MNLRILGAILISSITSFAQANQCSYVYRRLLSDKQVESVQKMMSYELSKSSSLIQTVPLANIQDLISLGHQKGMQHLEIYTGYYHGKKVLIKVLFPWFFPESSKSFNMTANEIRFAEVISRLNFGPHFYGTTTLAQNNLGLVFDFVEGQHYTISDSIEGLSPKSKNELKEIYLYFNEAGIFANDLQFIVSPDGKINIIDVSHYEQTFPGDPRIKYTFDFYFKP